MTSSWMLAQRKKNADIWGISNFGGSDNNLSELSDHYIINGAVRECHPDFEAIPIDSVYGFMVCKRRNLPPPEKESIHPSEFNGLMKYSSDLYRPLRKTAIQITDPYPYNERTIPNEEYLRQFNYFGREIQYDGTGIRPVRYAGPMNYYDYGSDYAPNPPYKYDVTQLHQKYPIWKEMQMKYYGMTQSEADKIDQTFTESVTSGAW